VRLQPSQCQNATRQVADKLVTSEFNRTTTRGFASREDLNVAVCLLSGTELSFSGNGRRKRLWSWSRNVIGHKTAIFRQINLANRNAHHDALEFPDGEIILLTRLKPGQEATVLQLPATGDRSKLPQPGKLAEAHPFFQTVPSSRRSFSPAV
jgi:hypothetical protein